MPADELRRISTPSSCAAAPPSRAICPCQAATSRASISPWNSCTPTPRACSTPTTPTANTSPPRARTSSSSAAATPAPTASAPRCGTAARACPVRDPAQAAAGTCAGQSLAAVAQGLQARLRPGRSRRQVRRRPARIPDQHQEIRRRRATATSRNCTPSASNGSRTMAASCRKKFPAAKKILPAQLVLLAMGFLGPENQLLDKLGVEQRPAQQRQGRLRQIRHQRPRHLRRRRHAPRPKPGRLGDQRRPRRRPRMRPLSDGGDGAAIGFVSLEQVSKNQQARWHSHSSDRASRTP